MGERICYLHVGTGKAGSSAIQYAFTRHRGELQRRGFHYPDAARNFTSVLERRPTAGNARGINRKLRDGDVEAALRLVDRHVHSSAHLILSAEGLSNPKHAHLSEFAAGLRSRGFTTKCLVVFRPQVDIVVSAYLQQVKSDKPAARRSLPEYAEVIFSNRKLVDRWNWHRRAEMLKHAFDDVTVEWYPALRRRGHAALVEAAFRWLGVPSRCIPSSDVVDRVINPTPGREALLLLRRANEAGVGGRLFADEFLQRGHDRGLLGHKINLDGYASRRIFRATLHSNQRLLEEFCKGLDAEKELVEPGFADIEPPIREAEAILNELRKIARDVLASRRPQASPEQLEPVVGTRTRVLEAAETL